MSASRRTIAVVVHWQDPEDTLGCVASCAGECDLVVVVDNGSREPVGARLAAAAPAAICIRTAENLGYAGGANVGIRAATTRGAGVVLLLNNDVRLRPGATAAARRLLDADPRVGVVGAKVLTREDPSRLWLAWGEVTWRQSLVALQGADAPDGPRWNATREVEWVGGCTMWLRAAALADVGGFDEAFFAYHEEVEWCVRAAAAGWRVVYCPDAVATHTGRGSAGGTRSVRIRKYFAARNSVLFARRHGSPAQRLRLGAFLVATLPFQLAWNALRGRAGETWLKVLGLRDALTGRRPPFERLGLK
ncbi:MAG: glycosyltransferase family 2 protein [bacterium]|nr:glycosyltransferase family 2 protein [bacterium]